MITQNIITEKNLSELDVITRLFEQVVELTSPYSSEVEDLLNNLKRSYTSLLYAPRTSEN